MSFRTVKVGRLAASRPPRWRPYGVKPRSRVLSKAAHRLAQENDIMAEIFLYRHGANINPQQLQKLRRSGYICVGVKYLSDAKVLEVPLPVPIPQARMDLILRAACMGMTGWDGASRDFGRALT